MVKLSYETLRASVNRSALDIAFSFFVEGEECGSCGNRRWSKSWIL